jgi:hypothetical protein
MARWTPRDLLAALHKTRLVQVVLVFLGASVATLEAVDLVVEHLGLPAWVFPGSALLLLLGLPVIIATALLQAGLPQRPSAFLQRSETAEVEADPPVTLAEVAAVARGWLTWRRAIMGGVFAFALLGVVTTGHVLARLLEVKPVRSLVAAGVIDSQQRVILADLKNVTGDSLLAIAVTGAIRMDLAQSKLVTLAEPEWVGRIVAGLGKDPTAPLELALARDVALSEGLCCVIGGEIGALGSRYLLSVQLVAAGSGEVLVAFRETAEDSEDLMSAIEKITRRFR